MDPNTIQAWITVGGLLVSAGIATVAQVKGLIASHHLVLSEADLNTIAEGIKADAERRKALAEADAAAAAPAAEAPAPAVDPPVV